MSASDSWHLRASVRTQPAPDLTFDPKLSFYSRALSMTLGIPQLFGELDTEHHEDLLKHDLYRFLSFTEQLELGAVNDQLSLLGAGRIVPWLTDEDRLAATQMLTDEGSHAEMSLRLRLAVQSFTGIQPIRSRPAFLDALERMRARTPPNLQPLVDLGFVCVSETLITGSLSKLPHDVTVQGAVREVNRLHARDEAQHHKFFRRLFVELWPRLDPEAARILGELLPLMLAAFLDPDVGYIRRVLAVTLPQSVSVEQIVNDVFSDPAIRLNLYHAAQPSLAMMAEAGVFDDGSIDDAFRRAGFVP